MSNMNSDVVLVCLQNRTREVLPTDGMLKSLEEAVRATFCDVPSLTDSSQLILQVWICMYMVRVYTYICICVCACLGVLILIEILREARQVSVYI